MTLCCMYCTAHVCGGQRIGKTEGPYGVNRYSSSLDQGFQVPYSIIATFPTLPYYSSEPALSSLSSLSSFGIRDSALRGSQSA